jgi:serine phosphatase RsbU (regulator of sigma subunit)
VTGEVSHEPLLVFAQHREGHRIPVEVTVAPIRNAQGNVVGGIEVFRDMTELFKDLRRARAIQDHALTSALPDDPRLQFEVRYSPEGVVGGDFYRVEALDADCYAVLVADVMGHGVAAALYTMQLRTFWDDCRKLLRSPAGFLRELNAGLGRLVGDEGHFATGVFGLVDLAAGELTLVRAGHPPPFLLRPDSAVRSVGEGSPAIGLVKEAVYRESRERFEPGDTLLLFTDGATEISNAAGNELGEDGLRGMLDRGRFAAGRGALEWLEKQLLEYSQRIRLPDDLTLLSLHRPPAPPSR